MLAVERLSEFEHLQTMRVVATTAGMMADHHRPHRFHHHHQHHHHPHHIHQHHYHHLHHHHHHHHNHHILLPITLNLHGRLRLRLQHRHNSRGMADTLGPSGKSTIWLMFRALSAPRLQACGVGFTRYTLPSWAHSDRKNEAASAQSAHSI